MLIRVIDGDHHKLGEHVLCSKLEKAVRVHDAGHDGVIILVPDGNTPELEKIQSVGLCCEDVTSEVFKTRERRMREVAEREAERDRRIAWCVEELQRRRVAEEEARKAKVARATAARERAVKLAKQRKAARKKAAEKK